MRVLMLMGALVLFGCGPDNISDCDTGKKQVPCSEKSAEEKGRAALDGLKFSQAAEYFLAAIDADPENFNLYTLLSTSYAGAAGFRLLDVTRAQMDGDGSILELMDEFLPTPSSSCVDDVGEIKAYALCLESIEAARITADLPAAAKVDRSADYFKTASKQMLFYGAASMVMQINRFSVSAANGSFDPNQLRSMTEDDAISILTALASAATAPGLEDNEATKGFQDKVAATQAEIQSYPGATVKDKVAAYVSKKRSPRPQGQSVH